LSSTSDRPDGAESVRQRQPDAFRPVGAEHEARDGDEDAAHADLEVLLLEAHLDRTPLGTTGALGVHVAEFDAEHHVPAARHPAQTKRAIGCRPRLERARRRAVAAQRDEPRRRCAWRRHTRPRLRQPRVDLGADAEAHDRVGERGTVLVEHDARQRARVRQYEGHLVPTVARHRRRQMRRRMRDDCGCAFGQNEFAARIRLAQHLQRLRRQHFRVRDGNVRGIDYGEQPRVRRRRRRHFVAAGGHGGGGGQRDLGLINRGDRAAPGCLWGAGLDQADHEKHKRREASTDNHRANNAWASPTGAQRSLNY
jgi:hypothetical protein